MNKKTKVLILIVIASLISIILGSFLLLNKKTNKNINKIKYSPYVKTINNSNLYIKKNNKYKKIGTISKNKNLLLEKQSNKYFKIKDSNYYIDYYNVEKTNKFNINNRYKNYLLFNENIITKDKVKLYQNNKVIYRINKLLDLPIIIKDDNGYYIEFNNELYLIKNEDISKTYEKNNSNLKEAIEIPVTVYHFIYLNNEDCNEVICNSENQVREHFNYLKDNNYFTINTKEMELFIDKKIRLKDKSILITIDDGAKAENIIPILEEYRYNATLFLVTSWYPKEKFKSDYLEIASHSDNLHEGGKCPGEQGSAFTCLDKNILLDDLKKSREKLNNTEAFCYPLYEFNDYSESILKEAGFKSAYIGGMIKTKQSINKYQIPRITIFNDTKLDEYIKYIN